MILLSSDLLAERGWSPINDGINYLQENNFKIINTSAITKEIVSNTSFDTQIFILSKDRDFESTNETKGKIKMIAICVVRSIDSIPSNTQCYFEN